MAQSLHIWLIRTTLLTYLFVSVPFILTLRYHFHILKKTHSAKDPPAAYISACEASGRSGVWRGLYVFRVIAGKMGGFTGGLVVVGDGGTWRGSFNRTHCFWGWSGSNLMQMWQRCFCFSEICSKMNSHSALFGLVDIKQTPEGCGLFCCLGESLFYHEMTLDFGEG